MSEDEYTPTDDPNHIAYYAKDIWYMASWEERERLANEAEKEGPESIAERRLMLWDFFFHIWPKHIEKSQKAKISKLEKVLGELEKIQENLIKRKKEIQEYARYNFQRKQTSKHQVGVLFTFLGAVGGFIGTIITINVVGSTSSAKDSFSSLFICCINCILPAIGLLLLGMSSLRSVNKQISNELLINEIESLYNAEYLKVEDHIKNLVSISPSTVESYKNSETYKANHSQKKSYMGLYVKDYIAIINWEIKMLESQTRDLIAQIPKQPSVKLVEKWFMEVIEGLRAKAIKETGMEERLTKILVNREEIGIRDNVFCIHGPAELQSRLDIGDKGDKHSRNNRSELQIPSVYFENKDYKRHWRSRRYVKIDGQFADFYGVYYIQFLLVGVDVIAIYSTFYDFIMQRQLSPHTRVIHYLDIVSIQTSQDYIEWDEKVGERIELDSAPSLTLSLTSSEIIRITYPNGEYIQKTGKTQDESEIDILDLNKWKFDMESSAKNANRYIRERMQVVKNQLRGTSKPSE